jgi:hypothetical protein
MTLRAGYMVSALLWALLAAGCASTAGLSTQVSEGATPGAAPLPIAAAH